MQIVMVDFKTWCGLLFVQGAIDWTHISITKPSRPFDENYFKHKIGGYNIIAQAIVDIKKTFIDLFVGVFGSMNDYRMLRWSSLYRHAQYQGLFHHDRSVSEFTPTPSPSI
jgi:hypothetical protein